MLDLHLIKTIKSFLARPTVLQRLQNICILFLVLLAVTQASQLWFGDVPGQNYLNTFSGIVPEEEGGRFIKPYRVLINFGNTSGKNYSAIYSPSNEELEQLEDWMTLAVTQGEYVSSAEIDWEFLISPSIICEYSFPVPSELYSGSFSKPVNLTSKVKQVSSVILIPVEHEGKVRVIFLDETQAHSYVINEKKTAQELNTFISQEEADNSLNFVSSRQAGFIEFRENVFIPYWEGDLGYNEVTVTNPYSVKGDLLLNTIEKKIDVFFANPIAKWTSSDNSVYSYSDENIVVKYYPSDILEYSDYRPSKTVGGLISDYTTTIDFITKDAYIVNDYVLSDIVAEGQGSETNRTFFFDYQINNMPMILSDSFKALTKLSHPIQVTVENGKVTNYKKLVYNFLVSENQRTAALNINGVLDSIFAGEDHVPSSLGQVSLGYKIERGDTLSLFWFLDLGGSLYVKSAERK